LFVSGIAAALLLLLAIWGGSRFANESEPPSQTTAIQNPTPPAQSATQPIAKPEPTPSQPAEPAKQSAQPPAANVLSEVLPTVPARIQNKIQGRVYVTVRVLVDPNGNVVGVLMDNPGPSKYFARLSDQAARQWQFVPADTEDSRVWLLRFQYTRDGVAVRTIEQ
jgi:TonB family protein